MIPLNSRKHYGNYLGQEMQICDIQINVEIMFLKYPVLCSQLQRSLSRAEFSKVNKTNGI